MSEYMTTDEVCGRLSRAGIDIKTVNKVFAARLEPDAPDDPLYEHDPDKKYVLAVPEPGGRVFLVVYRFNHGNPFRKDRSLEMPQETGPDWRPRWLSVEGPFELRIDGSTGKPDPACELLTKARELTNE